MQNLHLDSDVLEELESSNIHHLTLRVAERLQSDLKIIVTDSEKGRAVSKAMISIDSIRITGVCNQEGLACIPSVPFGTYHLDIISAGFIAQRIVAKIYTSEAQELHVRMISNI